MIFYSPRLMAHGSHDIQYSKYSTNHQFSARALILGKNWVEKKAHCAVWAIVFGRG